MAQQCQVILDTALSFDDNFTTQTVHETSNDRSAKTAPKVTLYIAVDTCSKCANRHRIEVIVRHVCTITARREQSNSITSAPSLIKSLNQSVSNDKPIVLVTAHRQKLLDEAILLRASPDYCVVLLRKHEADRHHPESVGYPYGRPSRGALVHLATRQS